MAKTFRAGDAVFESPDSEDTFVEIERREVIATLRLSKYGGPDFMEAAFGSIREYVNAHDDDEMRVSFEAFGKRYTFIVERVG